MATDDDDDDDDICICICIWIWYLVFGDFLRARKSGKGYFEKSNLHHHTHTHTHTHTDTHEATSPGSRGHPTITGDRSVGRSASTNVVILGGENKTRMAGSTSLSSLSFRVHIDSSLCLSPSLPLSCGGPRFQRAPNEFFIIFHILFSNESLFFIY
jgi:hypothetical protein